MRLILDLLPGPTERIAGTLSVLGASPASFDGWVELMGLLEAITTRPPGGPREAEVGEHPDWASPLDGVDDETDGQPGVALE